MSKNLLSVTFREERGKKGMSQKAFAEMLGLSQETVSKIEQGANRLSPGRLKVVCDVLGLDPKPLWLDYLNTEDQ